MPRAPSGDQSSTPCPSHGRKPSLQTMFCPGRRRGCREGWRPRHGPRAVTPRSQPACWLWLCPSFCQLSQRRLFWTAQAGWAEPPTTQGSASSTHPVREAAGRHRPHPRSHTSPFLCTRQAPAPRGGGVSTPVQLPHLPACKPPLCLHPCAVHGPEPKQCDEGKRGSPSVTQGDRSVSTRLGPPDSQAASPLLLWTQVHPTHIC